MGAWIGGAGVGLAAMAWASAAPAQEFTAYFSCSTQISNGAITTVYDSGIFHAPYRTNSPREYANAFKAFLISQGLDAPYANCSQSPTTAKAFKWLDYAENHALKMKARFKVVNWAPSEGRVIARGEKDTPPQKTPARTAESKSSGQSTSSVRDPEQKPARTRAEYEAEWQAKVAAHEANVTEYKRKLAARQAEIERRQRQHAAAQDQAAQAKAAHEAKMEAHRRTVEEASRRRAEHAALLARHAACAGGDAEACAEIRQGKPTGEEKLADAGDASTDTDAGTCVSRPVVSGNATFEGNTAAMVVNGCETAVDVKICLMREGGWNCGMVSGLQPQDRWSHSSFKASGEIYWDARVAGSNEALGSP